MRILGIDPGYGITGFGLIEAQRGNMQLCNCGVITIPDLQRDAKITLVSATSIVEGGYHDVTLRSASMKE